MLILLQTGVIQEGIRLSFGVPGRLPRYAPTEDLCYAGYNLPRGVSLQHPLSTQLRKFTDTSRDPYERIVLSHRHR